MSKHHLPGILAMAIIVLTSNILVQFLFGNWLTWGAFTYPFAFLVTDIMNRVYGRKAAQQVILIGFIVGVFCSLIGAQVQGGFGALVALRIALGSGAFSAMFVFLEPTIDVCWAGEGLPMLGVGPQAPLWVALAFADWLVKLSLAIIALVPFRILVSKMLARTA